MHHFHIQISYRGEPGEELNPDCIAVTVKHSPSRMFWGCFSWRGLGPIVPLKGSVTG